MSVEPLLRPADVQAVLGVSKNRCYELLASTIPVIRLGRSIRVEPQRLRDWLATQEHVGGLGE